jgi:hypothetical protein
MSDSVLCDSGLVISSATPKTNQVHKTTCTSLLALYWQLGAATNWEICMWSSLWKLHRNDEIDQYYLLNFTYLEVTSRGSLAHIVEQHFVTPGRSWTEGVHYTCQMLKLQRWCSTQQNVQQLAGLNSNVWNALSYTPEIWNLLLGTGCLHVNSALISLVHLRLVPQILLKKVEKMNESVTFICGVTIQIWSRPFLLRFLDHTQLDTYIYPVGLLWTSDQPVTKAAIRNTQQTQEMNIHAFSRIETHDPSNQAAAPLCLRTHGH